MPQQRVSSGWLPNPDGGGWLYYEWETDRLNAEDGTPHQRPANWSRQYIMGRITHAGGRPSDPGQPRALATSVSTNASFQAFQGHSQLPLNGAGHWRTSYSRDTEYQLTTQPHSSAYHTQEIPTAHAMPGFAGPYSDDYISSLSASYGRVHVERAPNGEGLAGPSRPAASDQNGVNESDSMDQDTLDPAYRVRACPRKFFVVGKVFQALWSEPGGDHTSTASTDRSWSRNSFGEMVYSKTWRFVVVNENSRDCQALRITTYENRGVAKPGVIKADHAIIYTGKVPPEPTLGERHGIRERPMQPHAIRVEPDQRDSKLDPMSRVDFSRIYTIQHNIRVKPVGKVHINSMPYLNTQWQSVYLGQNPLMRFDHSTRTNGIHPSQQSQSPPQAWSPAADTSRHYGAGATGNVPSQADCRYVFDMLSRLGWSYDRARAVLRDPP